MSRKEGRDHKLTSSGSGALSHVYIQHPPLRCGIPETQGIHYDEANKLILSPTSDRVLSWKVGSFTEVEAPESDPIGEGPVIFIRYSLDKKVIAIQRSNYEVQFKNRETGDSFTRRYRPGSENVLGFFWTDCPTCDFIVIKISGLDLFSYEPEFNRLRLVETKRLNVSWYVYTHESRMVLLSSGMQCTIFSGFQFSSVGIVRLPKFEMKMAKSEANQKPVLSIDDVNIVTIYGRIYCVQVDRVDMQLHMYRFYRDAVVYQGSLPIYSTRIAVSVVDNVLIVHQVDAKVVILYDIFLDCLAPISAPLPLLLKATFRGISSSSSHSTMRQAADVDPNSLSAYEGMIFSDSWSFLVPNLICDVDHGLIWRLSLDLEAIAASSSDVPSVLEFLQRRRVESAKVKQLCLSMMCTIILERRPITVIARAIDVLIASYSQDTKLQNVSQRKRAYSGNVSSGEINSVGKTIHGESLRQESVTGEQNEAERRVSHHEQTDVIDPSPLTVDRLASCSVSDSESDCNLKKGMLPSEASHLKPCSSSAHSLGVSDVIVDPSHVDNMFTIKRNAEIVEHNQTVPNISYIQDSLVASAAVSPDELCHHVFSYVEEEMSGDPAYLVAIMVEFFRSSAREKLKINQDIYVMIIKLLVRNDSYARLGFFVINKIIEPSKEIALQLIHSGCQNLHIKKLGMEMLRQLSLHDDYVQALLQHGYYLESLQYARKYKVVITQPAIFLEGAFSGNNLEHLAAVLRFFSDYIPAFQSSLEYNRYSHILSEMS